MRHITFLITAAFALPMLSIHAQNAPTLHSSWVTLGTNAGPAPRSDRSEPANLLVYGSQRILVDCGDGTGDQLAKVGVSLRDINAILISHLHFDHTGGLFGILGARFQLQTPTDLTIYGPPGTQSTIDGLIAAMMPESESGIGIPNQPRRNPADHIHVIEINDGSHFTLGPIKVSARRNSHYSYLPGSEDEKRFVSLAYRFDLPDRSLACTGDTGPSKNVEELAQGVDILFSEVGESTDPVRLAAMLKARFAYLPPDRLQMIAQHMINQHLSPEQVGLLASNAKVKEVVLVHNDLTPASAQQAIATIHKSFTGKVIEAHDLDTF